MPATGRAVRADGAARSGPRASAPVNVIGTGLHEAVGVEVEVLPVHALVVAAGDDVKEMLDHAIGDEHFAVVVEVEAPGIGRSLCDEFKDVADWVIPPHAAIDR